ncbi:MAG TPA: 30S ribosomal protein S18 [Spirochaetota bacterium]|nr:30S ribosomal protein S18 [Spirochaetota bacterium]
MSEEIKNTESPAAEPAAPETEAPERKPHVAREDSFGEKPAFQRNTRFKRKVCRFCHDKNAVIDYKDVRLVEQFITDRGKILPRRVTGTCAKHQRGVAQAIKRARILALVTFVEK